MTNGFAIELGSGEAIPLPDDSVDLIYMSMCFHHFNDPRLVARECRRVLREGGTAFCAPAHANASRHILMSSSFRRVCRSWKICFPHVRFIREVFEAAGFSTVSSDIVVQTIAPRSIDLPRQNLSRS